MIFKYIKNFAVLVLLVTPSQAMVDECSNVTGNPAMNKQKVCFTTPGCTWKNNRCVKGQSSEERTDTAPKICTGLDWLGQCSEGCVNNGKKCVHAQQKEVILRHTGHLPVVSLYKSVRQIIKPCSERTAINCQSDKACELVQSSGLNTSPYCRPKNITGDPATYPMQPQKGGYYPPKMITFD